MFTIWMISLAVMTLGLLYQRATASVSAIAYGAFLLLTTLFLHYSPICMIISWVVYAVFFTLLLCVPLRRQLLTRKLFALFKKALPQLSQTESQALEAGTVAWTGELFSGKPRWAKLNEIPITQLSEEERAYLDGPVDKLCGLIDNWEISKRMEIPESIWEIVRQEKIFGMMIPKRYGGKGFSSTMLGQVTSKISGLSVAVATTLTVPNSLGPAELLLHYGTEEQKDHYLPRLATAEEIPCFALTSPIAGSDAGAITDHGVLFEKMVDGENQLYIRLNWDKRYITLAPVATLLGLAFKLYDPDRLLGDKEDIGITCALIPTDTPGVRIGRKHFPLHCAFSNGPTQGDDVEVPAEWIIGGAEMAGQGWRMLMECLAVGRAVSIPSIVSGGAKKAALMTGLYARVRRQFRTAIGNFGGVSEAVTQIGAYAYLVEATRLLTVGSVEMGEKPIVESAITKCHVTEFGRRAIALAMDVHGGKGICMGPKNYLSHDYIATPICITVEGANILTRSMIIFGQGAIRCHPYMLKSMHAVAETDQKKGLIDFDRALFSHAGFFLSNVVRSLLLGLTRGRLEPVPRGPLKRYYQQLSRFSSGLALTSDVAMMVLGSRLKRLEHLSGRLGDVLSDLYMASAVIRYYNVAHEKANDTEELPVVKWLCETLLYHAEEQLLGFLDNFPNPILARFLRFLLFPLGSWVKPPKDRLADQVVQLFLRPGPVRSRLLENMYLGKGLNNPMFETEALLEEAVALGPLEKKLEKARIAGKIEGVDFYSMITGAQTAGYISESEADRLLAFHEKRMSLIHVDDFSKADFN